MKEQLEWKIPPCISNWKNPKVQYNMLTSCICIHYMYELHFTFPYACVLVFDDCT